MVVDDILGVSVGLDYAQVHPVALLTIFWLYFLLDLFLCVRYDLFPVGIDGTIASIDLFLETVIKTSLP